MIDWILSLLRIGHYSLNQQGNTGNPPPGSATLIWLRLLNSSSSVHERILKSLFNWQILGTGTYPQDLITGGAMNLHFNKLCRWWASAKSHCFGGLVGLENVESVIFWLQIPKWYSIFKPILHVNFILNSCINIVLSLNWQFWILKGLVYPRSSWYERERNILIFLSP